MTFGSLSLTAMSSMRPPMLAGPIDRNLNDASSGSADVLTVRARSAAACWPRGATMKSGNARRPRVRNRRMKRRFVIMAGILHGWNRCSARLSAERRTLALKARATLASDPQQMGAGADDRRRCLEGARDGEDVFAQHRLIPSFVEVGQHPCRPLDAQHLRVREAGRFELRPQILGAMEVRGREVLGIIGVVAMLAV